MRKQRYAELLFHPFVSENMIEMAMRIQQQHRFQLLSGNVFGQILFFLRVIASRINNDAFPGFIPKDVRVFLKIIEDELMDTHHVQNVLLSVFLSWMLL
jgi:hypothetical protein